MRTLIASLACAAVLLVAAVPAGASPVDGRPRPASKAEQANPTPVIRELHTVIRERDAGRTLAIVLAGAALVIATASAVYGRRVVARVS
jgi:hypothetical protein